MRHGSPREFRVSANIPEQFTLTPNFHLRGAPLPVEEDEAPDPVDVGCSVRML
jgi:hypothetical protein